MAMAWWTCCGSLAKSLAMALGGCPVAALALVAAIAPRQQLCLQAADVWMLDLLDRWESNITGECFLIMSTLPAPICPLARAPRSSPSPSSFSPAPHAPTTPPSPLLAGPPVGGPGPAPVPGLRQGSRSGPESGFRFGLGLARINEISKPKIPRHSY